MCSGAGMCKPGFPDDDGPRAGTFPVGTGLRKAGFADDDDAEVACSRQWPVQGWFYCR